MAKKMAFEDIAAQSGSPLSDQIKKWKEEIYERLRTILGFNSQFSSKENFFAAFDERALRLMEEKHSAPGTGIPISDLFKEVSQEIQVTLKKWDSRE